MGRLIGIAPGREQFARWLAGRVKTKPSAEHCRVLEHMFPGYSVAELLSPYDPEKDNPGGSLTPSDSATEEAATERRQVFQLGAVALTNGLLDSLTHGPNLLEQALHSTTISEGKLSLLEAEIDKFAVPHDYLSSEGVLREVLLNLSGVRELLKSHQPTAIQRRLARVAAKMCFVIAEHLFSLHQSELARRWWRSAFEAAEEAGDGHLADHAYAAGAYFPTYSGDPQGVLAHVLPRLEKATKATPSIAWMWECAAMAYGVLGEKSRFERANESARNALARCDPDNLGRGLFSYSTRRQAFHEARGRADLGDVEGAGEAASRALAAFDPTATTDPALTRLAYASALAKAGEFDEACSLATVAIKCQPVPVLAVAIRANEFNALVPPRAAAAREWRETLARIRAPRRVGVAL